MSTLDEFKKGWKTDAPSASDSLRYDQASLASLIKARSARQVNQTIQYFWASFTLQIIVYGLLTHLCIRFWGLTQVQLLCLGGGLLYLPFTFMLMRQFKRVVLAGAVRPNSDFSLQERVQQQYTSLKAFYRFKRAYEYGLVPLSTALGVWLTFMLYVPGGVPQHLTAAVLTYLVSLLACGWAIRRENRIHFEQPLGHLNDILGEFSQSV